MASHRKPRSRTAGPRTAPVVGITTAALTSIALLSQSATAAPSAPPKPSLEEVQKKVDTLYHQAGVATEKYNAAKERTTKQQKRVGDLLDDVAQRTEKLNKARQSSAPSPPPSTAPAPSPTPRRCSSPTTRRTTSTRTS